MKLFDDTTWIASTGKLTTLQRPMLLSADKYQQRLSAAKQNINKKLKDEQKT